MNRTLTLLLTLLLVTICGAAGAQARALVERSPNMRMAQFTIKKNPTPLRTDSFDQSGAISPAVGPVETVDTNKPGDFIGRIIDKLNALGDRLVADIDAADGMAAEIDPDTNKPKDEIAHACYPAAKKFVQSLQVKHDAVAGAGIVVLFERKRLLTMTIKKGLPIYLQIGCAPLLGDEAKILVGVVGMAGINLVLPGGGLAALGAKLPLIGLGGL
jgi:hypothetical protein